MTIVKYRVHDERLRPRRTKLEIPGWSGEPEPRVDGSHEHPWHCIPFSEAAKAGIELCYPYAEPLTVAMTGGTLSFTGAAGGDPPPFRSFGTQYYTYQSLIDLRVPAGLAIKFETHPRFYSDATGTVPIAVPAVIRHWWPMVYFLVFKSPAEGQAHVFRPGEPMVQITVVEADPKLDLVAMAEEEAAERELQSRRIYESRSTLSADTQWTSSTNTVFDGTYRRMAVAARGLTELSGSRVGGDDGGDGGGSAAESTGGDGDGGGDTAPSPPTPGRFRP